MSSAAPPISSARFAAALTELPLSSLHAKAAELRNSAAHLRRSNVELQHFADEGDHDCVEAIRENEEVMQRYGQRLELLKSEVQRRGMPWVEQSMMIGNDSEDNATDGRREINGHEQTDELVEMDGLNAHSGSETVREPGSHRPSTTSGRLTDEQLAARIRQQMGGDDDEDGGMHL